MTNKPPRTIDEQIAILIERGMQITDREYAAFYLKHISYYRLKGYWWDMQYDKIEHKFSNNYCFEHIIERYNFDRQLRLILFNAVEIIEIALRTKLIYHLSQEYGGLWYLDNALFYKTDFHKEHIEELKKEFARSKEIFAQGFREKYPTEDPDAWLILETISLGTLSKIYKNLNSQLKQKSIIANEFGLNLHNQLSSWLGAITYLRNIIAHHSRIFGRNMTIKPNVPKNLPNLWLKKETISIQQEMLQVKPFIVISIMVYLCNAIDPNNKIKSKILSLFKNNPNIPIHKIGFFTNSETPSISWQQEPLWA